MRTITLHNALLTGLVSASLIGLVGCGSSTPRVVRATSTPSDPPQATPSPTLIAAALCVPAPVKFDPEAFDLTGAWSGDDGGIYYVRQRDNVIWWNGMSGRTGPSELLGRDWNNVGSGEINRDLTIEADWADVPRGGIAGYGTVDFRIGADSAGNIQITKVSETGSGRGDTVWARCTPGFPAGL